MATLERDTAFASGACQASRAPHLLRFNRPAAPARHAAIAEILGGRPAGCGLEATRHGLTNNPWPETEADAVTIYAAAF